MSTRQHTRHTPSHAGTSSGLMSLDDAARYLGVPVATLRWWLYSLRLLPWYRIGARKRGRPMLRQSDLDQFIESRKVPAAVPRKDGTHDTTTGEA